MLLFLVLLLLTVQYHYAQIVKSPELSLAAGLELLHFLEIGTKFVYCNDVNHNLNH